MSYNEIKSQRDQSAACLILSVFILAAVVLSATVGTETARIAGARDAVRIHRELLKNSVKFLRENQSALHDVQLALASFAKAEGK
jgi:hypothetical protein